MKNPKFDEIQKFAARLFVQHAGDADIKHLAQALDGVVSARERGDAQEVLEAKNRFYDALFTKCLKFLYPSCSRRS